MAQTIPRSVAAVTGVPSNSTRARHRRPNHRLAGLTGIAIVVLTAGNLGLPLSGGYLAMDVLMVCIGFETARTLRCHADQKQRLKRYWLNEVGPMIAPVLLAVGLSTLQWSLYGELDQPQIRAILGGLTMTLNLFVVFGGADFAAIEHLWAIGVIAQFLVVAPVLVWGGRRYLNANNRAAALLGAAAGVAICRLSFLLTGGVGESSIAVNTLTRADALLVGLVIGVAPLGTLRRRLPANLAAPAFAMLLLLFISAPDQDDMPRVALGLMVTAAVALSALVAAWIAMGGLEGALSKTLDNLVLQWLGHRAISIYVWHQLFGLTISAEGLGVIEQTHEWPGTWVFVARVVFSLAAAATSHRYLEAPAAAIAADIMSRTATSRRPADADRNVEVEDITAPTPAAGSHAVPTVASTPSATEETDRPRRRQYPANTAKATSSSSALPFPAPEVSTATLVEEMASAHAIASGANHPVHTWSRPERPPRRSKSKARSIAAASHPSHGSTMTASATPERPPRGMLIDTAAPPAAIAVRHLSTAPPSVIQS